MQLKLIVVGGARSGDEVHVSVPKFIIGRDRDCHLRCNSDVVSRHHCALVVEPNYIAVVDFSSKNGTFVDGERVVREQELHTGSLLAVGPLQFLVQVSGIPLGKPVGKPVTGQRPQENEDHKTQTAREPEEIVDDWSDALDPAQLQSSLADSKRLKKNDRCCPENRKDSLTRKVLRVLPRYRKTKRMKKKVNGPWIRKRRRLMPCGR